MPRVFQPVPNTVELIVQGTLAGELVENKFYAKGTSAITSAMVAALAALVDDWVHTTYLGHLPADYTYVRSIARDLTVAASFEHINTTHTGEAGVITGAASPNNVTFAVHRATGLSGVKAKSRIYIPGVPDSFLATANTVLSTVASAYIGDLDTLRSLILAETSNTWLYGYVQRVFNHTRLTTGNFIEVIAHTVTDAILDSMRDRLPGHGL